MGSYGSPELHPKLNQSSNTHYKSMKYFNVYTFVMLPVLIISGIFFDVICLLGNSVTIGISLFTIPMIAAWCYSFFMLRKFTYKAYKINMYGIIYTLIVGSLFSFIMIAGQQFVFIIIFPIMFIVFFLTAKYFENRKELFAPLPKRKKQNNKPVADVNMRWKELLDAGAITQEEYDAKKSEILNKL